MTDRAAPRLAIGLISGTSMDGVDAALIECGPEAEGPVRLRAFRCFPYEESVRVALGDLVAHGGLARLARLNVVVGEVFAEAARALIQNEGVAPSEIECIGSHGQTVIHLPDPAPAGGRTVSATLQIGEPAVIAAATGIVTVADFRPMDLALGGQGAPLVPLLDWRLYRHPERGRVLLNLGGVANLTVLPAGCRLEEVMAFDTGPANALIDSAARARGLAGGIDRDGESARLGTIDGALLAHLEATEYLRRPPPKSADAAGLVGRLDDGADLASALATADLLATLTRHTASTIGAAVDRWVRPGADIYEVLVSGGGAHNTTLMGDLAAALAPTPVRILPVAEGMSGDAKEAAAFALLAHETLAGRPGNVPSATGARAPAVLGKIVPPPTPGQAL